jgi:hypothetical protein
MPAVDGSFHGIPYELRGMRRPLRKKEWTLLFYMSYPGPEDEKELKRDLEVLMSVGSNKHVNVVVQCRKPRTRKDANRFYVKRNRRLRLCEKVKPSRAKLGRPRALKDFVKWADKFFPSRKTFLIMWGHGYGPDNIFQCDPIYDWLQIPELAKALLQLKDERKRKLDVLGFDACCMQTVEVAYQLRDCVEYSVGSAVGTPRNAWQYAKLLEKVKEKVKKKQAGPKAVASMVLDCLKKCDNHNEQTILSVLDLEKSGELVGEIAELVESLKKAYKSEEQKKEAAAALQKAAWVDWRQLPDLGDVCEKLVKDTANDQVEDRAQNVQRLLESGRFVADKKLTDKKLRAPTGVSIYVPKIKVSGETDADIKIADVQNHEVDNDNYQKLDFEAVTGWTDWANDLPAIEEKVEDPCLWFRQTPSAQYDYTE